MLTAMASPPPFVRPAPAALFGPGAEIAASRRCYVVGQHVRVTGQDFDASAPFDLSIDGVDFGQSVTDATGGFAAALVPGGLGAGQIQSVERVTASDGTHLSHTSFTLTRRTGALLGASPSASPRRRVPFQVWDLAPTGARQTVYLHLRAPTGRVITTVRLGRTTGQCGSLRTPPRPLFPFAPGPGTWTFQFDTHRAIGSASSGRRARLRVFVP